jgi:hypothetical protein
MEDEIIHHIETQGPMTGSELLEIFDGDGLVLWRTCRLSSSMVTEKVGTRYLRLDRRVEGFGRLSPSMLREFLTYTVVGTSGQAEDIHQRARGLMGHMEEVNRFKLELAYRTVSALASQLDSELPLKDSMCFIIAGDIVHNMAHDVPRPERSTGKLVRGSDLDLVVVADEDCSDELMQRLDDLIFKEKRRLLITPHIREEIDYVVKRLGKVREQMSFRTFRQKVACKILDEGAFLFGSEKIFQSVKGLLRESGVAGKLRSMEEEARASRRVWEDYLLHGDLEKIRQDRLSFFYPTEESEEFE